MSLGVLLVLLGAGPGVPGQSPAASTGPRQRAEALARESRAQAEAGAAVGLARRALTLTDEFDPTHFVPAGRRGEVVEDAYVAALGAYRRHRAGIYAAVGEALSRGGRDREAARYLGRAAHLEASPEWAAGLARALLGSGRPGAALAAIEGHLARADLPPALLSTLQATADALGLPSVQAELDRARVRASKAGLVYRAGPFRLPPETRLSTGAPFKAEDGLTVVYVAATACASCSADVLSLREVVGTAGRVVLLAEDPDRDSAIRHVLRLYGVGWPMLVGRGLPAALAAPAGSALVIGRAGLVGVLTGPRFQEGLAEAVGLLGRRDVVETVPRPGSRPARITGEPPAPTPGLLPEGLAPGEDEPVPADFAAAVEAYREGRYLDALRLFEAAAAKGDGWLLPPEARLDRALCLTGLGRREEARRILLRIGDSRFQEAVDRALEAAGRARP